MESSGNARFLSRIGLKTNGFEERDEELKPKAVEKQLFGCGILCSVIILQCEYFEKFMFKIL